MHGNVPQTGTESTQISNALLRDPRLSFLARGLGCYIQSVPDGTDISIRALTKVATEGEVRVAAALRELEAAGYLERTRVRLPDGRLVTRTVSYNVPRPTDDEDPDPDPDRTPVPEPEPERAPVPTQGPPPPARPTRAAPADVTAVPDDRAARLLRSLSRVDPRLMLSSRDVVRLSPGVRQWLARGMDDEEVTRALTACLPLTHPAGLLAHRLTHFLPPAPSLTPPDREPVAPRWGIEFHNAPVFMSCDDCDRPFRSSAPGLCERCEAGSANTAAA